MAKTLLAIYYCHKRITQQLHVYCYTYGQKSVESKNDVLSFLTLFHCVRTKLVPIYHKNSYQSTSLRRWKSMHHRLLAYTK